MGVKIPVGNSDFKDIIENKYYYVDKTGLVKDLLEPDLAKVTLITRPRRFGKTLGMSMLANFFDIKKDSKALFNGLEITKHTKLCSQWMNQYPTIFVSFKDVNGLTFSSAYEMLVFTIMNLYKKHLYLLDSNKINSYNKATIEKIVTGNASVTEIKTSLLLLIEAMKTYYNKQVIVLIDEYDVPIAKASANGYYEEMMEVIRALMSTALKDNNFLKFAVLTGCLRVTKESIFTGTNNLVVNTINSSSLNEYFGFTQKDVDKLLEDAKMTNHAKDIKDWYDGYHFENTDVYCPWDVMNYLRDVLNHSITTPVSYWKNTSDNAIIRSFIDCSGSSITRKLETLMSGDYIIQKIEENLTYDYMHSSEENLWSILYSTGYLTKARNVKVSDGLSALMIPNKEVKEIFESTVQKWFVDCTKLSNREALFRSVWNKDNEVLTKEMNILLRRTISYHDYKEDFYHAFLAGIFTGAGYMVESNHEHGEGRSDVVVIDSYGGKVAIFEAKYSQSIENLETDCNKALNQINKKMYAKDFEDSYDEVLCFGISFYKKRCLVKYATS